MTMKAPNLYAMFAVILPVSLGLGLLYLSIVGRIGPAAAVMSALGLAAVIGVLVLLRDFSANDKIDDRRE